MRLRAAAAFSAVLVLLLIGACTGPTRTATVAQPAATPTAAATPAASCGDPTASLRPTALPATGQMPAGSYMRTIQDRGRIIAGVSQETLLFGSLNPLSGQIEGFDIDVLKQVSQAIFGSPDKIEFHAITTADRIPKIRDGSVDIVARTFTINCDRRTQVDFSSVYFLAHQKVLVPVDSKAASIADLGGKKVCATAGSTSLDRLNQQASKPVGVAKANFTDCLVALQLGEVDAISTDDAVLAGLAAQDPYTRVVGPPFSDEPYGLAVALNHPEFTRFVNGVLDQMRANGTWTALYQKWIGTRLGAVPAPPTPSYKD